METAGDSLFARISVHLPVCMSVCLPIRPFIRMSTRLSVCLSDFCLLLILFTATKGACCWRHRTLSFKMSMSVCRSVCLVGLACVLLVWRVCLSVCVSDPHASGNYVQRQISRWTKQYRVAETSTIGAMEELITRLNTVMPRNIHSTTRLVHGDYRYVDLRAICSRWQWGRGEGGGFCLG